MWAMDDSFSQARPLWYPRENSDIYPGLSLREDTGGCGGGTALGQGASDIRVPQGSVLGPCLFLHLLERIGSTVRLFADGTVMYLAIASQTDSHKLQTAKLDNIWQMHFYLDKCQVLRITNKRNQ